MHERGPGAAEGLPAGHAADADATPGGHTADSSLSKEAAGGDVLRISSSSLGSAPAGEGAEAQREEEARSKGNAKESETSARRPFAALSPDTTSEMDSTAEVGEWSANEEMECSRATLGCLGVGNVTAAAALSMSVTSAPGGVTAGASTCT